MLGGSRYSHSAQLFCPQINSSSSATPAKLLGGRRNTPWALFFPPQKNSSSSPPPAPSTPPLALRRIRKPRGSLMVRLPLALRRWPISSCKLVYQPVIASIHSLCSP